ncbi:anhydro-N-acetylmuramic acid kinase [Pseudomonadota bacterium]
MPEYYVGLMSGTSMDGIDAVLIDFSDSETPKLICSHSHDWPEDIHQQLLATRDLPDERLNTLSPLDIRLGEIFAEATLELLDNAQLSTSDIIAIGNHGQTIRHRPDAAKPFSLQIGDAKTLTQKTGIRVVDDFRTADIEAGGQGAPLAPAFHEAVFRSNSENIGVLNLGGIANLSVLPSDQNQPVTGFDTGPANTLMDAWIEKCCGKSFDENGDFARSGKINQTLLEQLLADNYFKITPPKSTGFELFNIEWLNKSLSDKNLRDADVQATLCELTAQSICGAIKQHAPTINHLLVCGGGVHNTYLLERIQSTLPECKVESTEAYGIHPDWMEAMAFAWLARCKLNNQPAKLASVTGASRNVVLGCITEA